MDLLSVCGRMYYVREPLITSPTLSGDEAES